MKLKHKKQTHGFTLVELAVVLVIIGLLVAGVLTGQALVKAASITSIATDFRKFQTSFEAFRSKYNAIPGDFRNAYTFFGSSCAGSAAACNGDGTGIVGDSASIYQEEMMFWRHLALSGLISGSYCGGLVCGACTATHFCSGINLPISKNSEGTFYAANDDYTYSATIHPSIAIGYWKRGDFNNSNTHQVILTPEDAYSVDIKMDDGMPFGGNVVARSGQETGVASGWYPWTDCVDNVPTATGYAFSITEQRCVIEYVLQR